MLQIRMFSRLTLALALGALALSGCDKDSKPAATAPAGSAEASKKTEDPKTAPKTASDGGAGSAADGAAAGAGDKVKVVEGAPAGSDDRYALQVETPEAKAGEEGKVTVRVVPKEPWHMNLDFPTSLKVQAPAGVSVANADLKKADAKLDEKACEFAVKFTPSAAGEQSFTGKFKFAVCQDEACSPVTEDLEFKVAVK